MMSTRQRTMTLAGLAVITLPACATMSIHTDHAPGVRFSEYRTYEWQSGTVVGDEYPGLRDESVDTAIRSSVERQLAAHDMRASEGAPPDLYLHYHLSMRDEFETVVDFDEETGWEQTYDIPFTKGTLVVDLVSAVSGEILWRASAQGALEDRSREWVIRRIDEALVEMFKEFPPLPR